MYHLSQHSPEPTQLACVPLAKFSHTTTSIGHNGPLNWTHIIGNGDIVGKIESHTVSGPTPARVLLKVFRDYELLEEVDLTYHTQEAAKSALSGNSVQVKPVFAVIVKLPCLAVKYPKDSICIRRFQIKFSSDRDYYSTLVILSNIKCPFSESNVGSLAPARRPSQWCSGSVASAPTPPHMFPSVPGAPGMPTLNNMFLPSQSSATIDPSARSSTTALIGHAQRPASSSTTHTLTDLVPTNNGQALPPSSTLPSSRPSTAFHDAQTLDEVLPPRRALPFAKPAAKKPRTSGKQTNNASRPRDSGPEKTQASIRDHYDSTPFKTTNDTNNASGIKRSLTSFSLQSTHSEPANRPPPSQQNMQASTNGPIPIPIQPAPPTAILFQQELSYNNTASRPQSHTNISRNDLPVNIPPQSQQQQQRNAIPMNVSPLQPQPQPQFQQQLQQQQPRQPDPIADLASYTSDPKVERIARLETWICSQIQNDDFISLAEDVEGLWQRFAFGKW